MVGICIIPSTTSRPYVPRHPVLFIATLYISGKANLPSIWAAPTCAAVFVCPFCTYYWTLVWVPLEFGRTKRTHPCMSQPDTTPDSTDQFNTTRQRTTQLGTIDQPRPMRHDLARPPPIKNSWKHPIVPNKYFCGAWALCFCQFWFPCLTKQCRWHTVLCFPFYILQ